MKTVDDGTMKSAELYACYMVHYKSYTTRRHKYQAVNFGLRYQILVLSQEDTSQNAITRRMNARRETISRILGKYAITGSL